MVCRDEQSIKRRKLNGSYSNCNCFRNSNTINNPYAFNKMQILVISCKIMSNNNIADIYPPNVRSNSRKSNNNDSFNIVFAIYFAKKFNYFKQRRLLMKSISINMQVLKQILMIH